MLEEKKTLELSDDELEQASGGISDGTFTVSFNASGCSKTPATVRNIESGSTFSSSGNSFIIKKTDGSKITVTVLPDSFHNGSATWNPSSGTINSNKVISVSFNNNII